MYVCVCDTCVEYVFFGGQRNKAILGVGFILQKRKQRFLPNQWDKGRDESEH